MNAMKSGILVVVISTTLVVASIRYYERDKEYTKLTTKEAWNESRLDQPPSTTAAPFAASAAFQADSGLNRIAKSIAIIEKTLPEITRKIEENNLSNSARIKKVEDEIGALVKEINVRSIVDREDPEPKQDIENQIADARTKALSDVAAYDEVLFSEERDEKWANNMEESIDITSANQRYAGSIISDVVCKSTFCKLNAYHDDLESRDQFELIRREFPNSYHIQHFEDGDGGFRSVMYLIREGEESNSVILNAPEGSDSAG